MDDALAAIQQRAASASDPSVRASLESVAQQYLTAKEKISQYGGSIAMSNMMQAHSYWNVATFDCSTSSGVDATGRGSTQ